VTIRPMGAELLHASRRDELMAVLFFLILKKHLKTASLLDIGFIPNT